VGVQLAVSCAETRVSRCEPLAGRGEASDAGPLMPYPMSAIGQCLGEASGIDAKGEWLEDTVCTWKGLRVLPRRLRWWRGADRFAGRANVASIERLGVGGDRRWCKLQVRRTFLPRPFRRMRCDAASDYQGVDLAGAFVGVERFGVGDEAADVVVEEDAVAAQ